MSQPSMLEAAKIRDVAARHAYVFDNGLSSPDFFDLEKRMASEEFILLRERVFIRDSVLEIGSFTGLNLLGLAKSGHRGLLSGIEFVEGAWFWFSKQWCNEWTRNCSLRMQGGNFPEAFASDEKFDAIVCFDVLEHQRNMGEFLDNIPYWLAPNGRALFLVPIGREFYDCGHVAFFPDLECLRNVLDYVFEVDELFELKTSRKMFASCRRRG